MKYEITGFIYTFCPKRTQNNFFSPTLKLNNTKVLSSSREDNHYDGFKFHLGCLLIYENSFYSNVLSF